MGTEPKMEALSSGNPAEQEFSKDEAGAVEEGGLSDPNHVDLHRALKARHITMIGVYY